MNEKQFQDFLDAALKRNAKAPQTDDAAVERVLKRLGGPLPRQKMPLWRLPNVLLDWQYAPAWPRGAWLRARHDGARPPHRSGGRRLHGRSSTDLGSFVFEPEALTGARP